MKYGANMSESEEEYLIRQVLTVAREIFEFPRSQREGGEFDGLCKDLKLAVSMCHEVCIHCGKEPTR